jgi:hypothetical protein
MVIEWQIIITLVRNKLRGWFVETDKGDEGNRK